MIELDQQQPHNEKEVHPLDKKLNEIALMEEQVNNFEDSNERTSLLERIASEKLACLPLLRFQSLQEYARGVQEIDFQAVAANLLPNNGISTLNNFVIGAMTDLVLYDPANIKIDSDEVIQFNKLRAWRAIVKDRLVELPKSEYHATQENPASDSEFTQICADFFQLERDARFVAMTYQLPLFGPHEFEEKLSDAVGVLAVFDDCQYGLSQEIFEYTDSPVIERFGRAITSRLAMVRESVQTLFSSLDQEINIESIDCDTEAQRQKDTVRLFRHAKKLLKTYKFDTQESDIFLQKNRDELSILLQCDYLFEQDGYEDFLQRYPFLRARLYSLLQNITTHVEVGIRELFNRGYNGESISTEVCIPMQGIPEMDTAKHLLSQQRINQRMNKQRLVAEVDAYTRMGYSLGYIPPEFTVGIDLIEFTDSEPPVIQGNNDAQMVIVWHTLHHEIMEHAMKNLSLNILAEWDELSENSKNEQGERVSVTDYVRSTESNSGSLNAKREDLCESWAMFKTVPEHLFTIDKARYFFMLKLNEKFMPADARIDFLKMQMILLAVYYKDMNEETLETYRQTLVEHDQVPLESYRQVDHAQVKTIGEAIAIPTVDTSSEDYIPYRSRLQINPSIRLS